MVWEEGGEGEGEDGGEGGDFDFDFYFISTRIKNFMVWLLFAVACGMGFFSFLS